MIEPICWKCGASLNKVPTSFGRHAECPACHSPLHVCRQCRHFDTAKAKSCREPMAEPVLDKVRVNFCEWFQAGAGIGDSHRQASRSSLDALFGESAEVVPESNARTSLNDLFGD